MTYVDPQTAPMPRNMIMETLQQQGVATRPGTHAVHMLEIAIGNDSVFDRRIIRVPEIVTRIRWSNT